MTIQNEIDPDLRKVLRRLKLGQILATLPERLTLAEQQKMPFQDFLFMVLSHEVQRRDSNAIKSRVTKAKLDIDMRLERWDDTAAVSYDQRMWSELCSLRFVRAGHNALILGPVGVGKTYLANALGHLACKHEMSVLMMRSERLFKELKASRLDNTYEKEVRRLMNVDLLILDDFGLDRMDAIESRDFYELVVERHQRASIVVTSNREPNEWLALMADPIRAQSAIDRLQNASFELVVEGESYRKRQKPQVAA